MGEYYFLLLGPDMFWMLEIRSPGNTAFKSSYFNSCWGGGEAELKIWWSRTWMKISVWKEQCVVWDPVALHSAGIIMVSSVMRDTSRLLQPDLEYQLHPQHRGTCCTLNPRAAPWEHNCPVWEEMLPAKQRCNGYITSVSYRIVHYWWRVWNIIFRNCSWFWVV